MARAVTKPPPPHTHTHHPHAQVIPWENVADLSSERGLLAALVDAAVPVSWFGFTAVKAAVLVQWREWP